MKETRAAIITGSSKGIGASIAKRLAKDGINVVVNYSGSEKEANEVADEINSLNGGKAIVVQADVSKTEDVKRLFDETEKAFGRIDILVNNAGVMALAPISETDDESLAKHIDTNLKGTFKTLRQASTRLRNGGSIINVSTSVVGLNLEKYGIYAATKAAVETLTRIMAKELRGKEIKVNAIAPGPTATDLFLDGKSDEFIEKLSNMSPLERLAQPEDISGVVSFLASPDGAWVNAQIIRVNGGIV
ncbi:SDR family oxidoreductase [Luteolibacter sp. AS25]|uniref:SDR family oxidoreductase n=1 Tax=Luteolibacter sp. AS25 TaxID=3135776 RepID=UPI00398B031A